MEFMLALLMGATSEPSTTHCRSFININGNNINLNGLMDGQPTSLGQPYLVHLRDMCKI